MKKVLSILLCVMMVAGLFVALIPTASAKPATIAEAGQLIYSEDFEGENLSGKTDNTLTKALGWVQWNDSGSYTKEGYMNGLNGRGVASIVDDNGNKSIQMQFKGDGGLSGATGDAYGWGIEVTNDPRLAGGNYIIDYTATIVSETDSGAQGIGWRNNRCYGYDRDWITSGATAANTGATYHVHIKSTGAYDMHLKATNTTYTGVDASSASLGNLIGVTNTYRTVVSATEGIHTYVWKNGAWSYYFGMKDNSTAQFATDADTIGSGLVLRVCRGVTAKFDNIAVYTIKEPFHPTVDTVGFQTTVAQNERFGLRLIGSVSDSTDVKSAGFKLSLNGGAEKTVYLHYAYKSISTNYGSGSMVAPADGFLGALTINNCPQDSKIAARFFVIGTDGTEIIGDTIYAAYRENGDPVPDNPATESNGVQISKKSNQDLIRTVHPGDEILYTFTLKNTTDTEKTIVLTDSLPSHTTYKKGNATVNGTDLRSLGMRRRSYPL